MKKLLLLMCIVPLLFSTGCSISINDVKENQGEVNQTQKEEDVAVDNETVVKLAEKMHYFNKPFIGDQFFGYFYTKDSYSVDTMSNQAKLFLAIHSLYESSWMEAGISDKIQLSEEKVKSSYESIFGTNTSYQNESLTGSSCGFAEFTYDASRNVYEQSGAGCGGTALPVYVTKIISAKKSDSYLTFTEKVAYVAASEGTFKVYKSKSDSTVLGNETDDVITTYYDQLDSYQYTFRIENGNYYFESVKKVK